jgi:hypothetical protein
MNKFFIENLKNCYSIIKYKYITQKSYRFPACDFTAHLSTVYDEVADNTVLESAHKDRVS